LPKAMFDHRDPHYVLVQKPADLARIAVRLKREKALGVDLEGDSMFHYQEKVCLLQVSTTLENFVFDPLALGDLSPLAPLFADAGTRKVFHGSDYDIRSLQRDFGIRVNSLFDTQIAARFLGMGETSLASLLKSQFGVIIGKKYQKRDWSERPLPHGMLSYAVRDSCYLLPLARVLENEVLAQGRLSWVEEENELLSKVSPAPRAQNPLFLKFKGASKLDRRSLSVLESVLQFRDRVARRRDLPPFKVLSNGPIMEMAQQKPTTEKALKTIKGLGPKQVEALGCPLLEQIKAALTLSEDSLPVYPRGTPEHVPPGVRKRGKALKKWREERSRDLGIDSALVCTNTQIQLIARENPKNMDEFRQIQGIRNWQKHVFGPEICARLKTIG